MAVSYGEPQAMDLDNETGAEVPDARPSAARSCTTCSKAKAKCVKLSGKVICERCARLHKDCQTREPVARRRKTIKATRAAQLEKLEGKIEHLVNALSKSQAERAFSSVDYGQPSPPVSSVSDRSDNAAVPRPSRHELLHAICNETCPSGEEPAETAPTTAQTFPAPTDPSSPQVNDACHLGVSLSCADILLDRYRRLMAHANPFVVVPNGSAQMLSQTHPFLLHAIVTVTYFHDLPRQQKLVKEMMRDVSERILINGEKSIDILQGIIVFVSWYHPHVFWSNQVTNLLHLAIAMTVELGIDRAPDACHEFKPATVKAIHSQRAPKTLTLEDHRTLAGVFYLTGMLASSFKKIDAMPYTKHLAESVVILERAAEVESDMLVVQMVRLQHLIQETYTTEITDTPPLISVRAFRADLQRLRLDDPCKDTDNVFLRLQYLTAEVLIDELMLIDIQDNHARLSKPHIDALCRSVKVIKGFIDTYFSLPSSIYLTIPFSTFGQFAHTFIVLIKLASLEVEGWDIKDFKDELDLGSVLDEAAARLDAATKSSPDGLTVDNDIFSKWAKRIRWMKSVHEAKFSPENGDATPAADTDDRGLTVVKAMSMKPPGHPVYMPPQNPAVQGAQQPTPADDLLSGDFFNYLDEGFWQSFGTDYDAFGFADVSMGAMGMTSCLGQSG